MRSDQIVLAPLLTEKTNAMREGDKKKYVFKVHQSANKMQIITAVHELFSVRVESCNVMNVCSKPRASRTRSGYVKGSTTPWKKAIVTLESGQTIDAIDGV